MRLKYGVCDCGKWGIAPTTFRETKHFLKCPSCGKAMYLHLGFTGDIPTIYGERNKVTITELINHKGE